MRKRVLFIMQLPPPVHGSSMAGDMIRRSALINDEFDCRYVNLSASRRSDEVSNYSPLRVIGKTWRFVGALLKTLWYMLTFRPEVSYVTITCHGVPFLKDAPFVLLSRWFGCRIVLHQHNKGLSECVGRFPYKWLMPMVYRGAMVVLLSERLYDDVAPIVKREQVVICPNGI